MKPTNPYAEIQSALAGCAILSVLVYKFVNLSADVGFLYLLLIGAIVTAMLVSVLLTGRLP